MSSTAAPDQKLAEFKRAADQALRAKDLARAGQVAADAAEAGLRDAALLQLAAHHYLRSRTFDRALLCAEQAVELAPQNADALGTLGFCRIANGMYKSAAEVLDRSLAIAPSSPPLHFNKGLALECMGELAAARAQYRRAASLAPRYAEALGRAGYLAALQGDMKEARDLGTRSLAADATNIWGMFGLSIAEIDYGKLGGIEKRLKPICDNLAYDVPTRSQAYGILGDAFDAAGEHDRAFQSYETRGRIGHTAYTPPPELGFETQLERVRRLDRYFASADPAPWRERQTAPSPVGTHVFLLGFARSGTTLLEQVLAAHGGVEVMGERDCLGGSYPFTDSNAQLDRFAAMTSDELMPYRISYWKRVQDTGAKLDRPVFVDKMPLNSVLLCLIARLFPDAKIILAVRDPRDVVFSSFRRRFGITQHTYELLTLEGAAAYYDAVMSLVQTYRSVLKLDLQELRYEDLVADFEGACAGLCTFLGIEYNSGMRDFAQKARLRDVNTPSAAQVVRELSTEGSGQWRPYAQHMAPVMPLLSPWVGKFGYGS
jgi:tetratricopeptide (TPR) repeat protein